MDMTKEKVQVVETSVVKREEVTKWNSSAAPLVDKAALMKVGSVKQETTANEFRKEIKIFVKRVDDRMAEIEDPQKEIRRQSTKTSRSIKELFSGITKPCKEAIAVIDTKILAFVQAEELKAQEREAERQKELDRIEREQREALEKAERLKTTKAKNKALAVADVLSDQAVAIESSGPVVAARGNSTVVKRWVYELTSDLNVPREYLMVNDALIKLAIRDGVREIAGVRIYQTNSVGGRFNT